MKIIKVGVFFGGRSAEHEVSIQSAKNIVRALDPKKFQPVLIGIDKSGTWHIFETKKLLAKATDYKPLRFSKTSQTSLVQHANGSYVLKTYNSGISIDVAFPVLHGTYGEDGTIQGLLKLAGIPFVGSGVLGSAVGMDKDVAKRLMRDAGLPIPTFLTYKHTNQPKFEEVKRSLGLPFFVKPANLGSSVGISKVHNEKEFYFAVKQAFSFDSKIIIEEGVDVASEIEVSVLGNDDPIASVPGEVKPTHEFYDYAAKYLDENGAIFQIPAKLKTQQIKELQVLAVKTFHTLDCEGMARVDFLLSKTGKIYVNEVNTIPGFTNISMYPKLWEVSGLSQSELLERLISLAFERRKREELLSSDSSKDRLR